MDILLEKHVIYVSYQDLLKNLNGPITIKEIKAMSSYKEKASFVLQVSSTNFQRVEDPNFMQYFLNNQKLGNISQLILQGQDNPVTKNQTKILKIKEYYRPIYIMNINMTISTVHLIFKIFELLECISYL